MTLLEKINQIKVVSKIMQLPSTYMQYFFFSPSGTAADFSPSGIIATLPFFP